MRNFFLLLLGCLLTATLFAVPVEEGMAPATANPLVQLADGLGMERFSEDGQVINPTALSVDEKGQVFVAETHRWRIQIQDNRKMKDVRQWEIDDLGSRTTDDRIALYKKWSGIELPWEDYTREDEKIRLLIDKDGDGKADSAKYYAEGFNSPLAGTAGGIMALNGKVWFACIPSIYVLEDRNGDDQAERQEVIQDGFGVRVSLSGHDLNGFALGHDGRVYWSMGDRGYSFTTEEGVAHSAPGSGAVFRCEQDGSNVEAFYTTLRNPKEIAFNDRGDLFTVDNNADYGDRARIVYLVEGGEAGWQTGHQSLGTFAKALYQENDDPHFFDPPERWMAEGVWETEFEGRPRFALPPVAYLSDGPCGLVFNPGTTRLGPEWDGTFLVADYRGTPTVSGIRGFRVMPKGGGYALRDDRWFLKGAAITDMEFGPKGELFVSDYIGGWGQPEGGRIWRVHSEGKPIESEFGPDRVGEILGQGFGRAGTEDWMAHLSAPDRRIRLAAQLELEKRNGGDEILADALVSGTGLARLHGLWGLGTLARRGNEEAGRLVIAALTDTSPEMRRQAARAAGDAKLKSAFVPLRGLLGDEPSVVVAAAVALSNLGMPEALEPAQILALRNDRKDPYIEHGAVMILARCGDDAWIEHLSEETSPAVRHAACLALRKLRSPKLATFLKDADPQIAAEAARAIYDLGLTDSFSALADRLEIWKTGSVEIKDRSPMAARRALHAAFHSGTSNRAEQILAVALDDEALPSLRSEALVLLSEWDAPHPVDRVTGERSLSEGRKGADITGILEDAIDTLAFVESDDVLIQVTRLARKRGLEMDSESLFVQAGDSSRSEKCRLAVLAALRGREVNVPVSLLEDPLPAVMLAATELEAIADPSAALRRLERAVSNESLPLASRQQAWSVLGSLDIPGAGRVLAGGIEKALKREFPQETLLDLLEAAEKSPSPEAATALAKFEALPGGPWAGWKPCLEGGDPALGQKIFREHGTAQCTRCHAIDGWGGAAGPDLSAIGRERDRKYILRSLLSPAMDLAPGYGIVSITLKSGDTEAGLQLGPPEKDGSVSLQVGEEFRRIPGSDIESISPPISSMPPMSALLTKREIRDLVAYLAARQQIEKPGIPVDIAE